MKKRTYSIYRWLFFGGADRQISAGMSKKAAEKLCKMLNRSNGDSTYSGYYMQEEVWKT